ncbi:3-deoxy-D-manno-octulosonic acid transferase [Nitrincola tibetensis]|uniref:3-deoxy-D-manno-octulosonic acid transferase n=1 Tax=Nitrincola tibetensis TaxID=2219697 RepID=A0A364NNV9_9GAMM|nr:lipid IV(A) 3-deoxy-D-manno-octulosonic acid transferase [Nitrincola tibetensis]RAU18781.1 3-deoxy-D-manno-octulosonic acid transferase [Nitrincola tibetensis]
MARFFYNLVLHLLLPAILFKLWLRARKAPAYAHRWTERLGKVHFPAYDQPPIWIHAVSVGEVQAISTFVRHCLIEHPSTPIVITTMTPTGAERVKALFGDQVTHRYCPYDFPWAMQHFVQALKPQLCLIVETELWPNLLHACQVSMIPVILANARLSERSAKGYAKFKGLTRFMLDRITHIAVQNHEDAERFAQLGARQDRMSVIGSIKFDVEIDPEWSHKATQFKQAWGAERPVILAASTHDDEEALLLSAFEPLHHRYPDLLLLIAPRHPERFDACAELCERSAFKWRRRSEHSLIDADTQVFLIDRLGELMPFCSAADIVFIGGSLVERGGHNPLEPAMLGKPVIIGPHTYNFALITKELANMGGLVQVSDHSTLIKALENWLDHKSQQLHAGQQARAYVEQQQGALDKLKNLAYVYLSSNA